MATHYLTRYVPLSTLLLIFAAVVQHRFVAGLETFPLTLFVSPVLLGVTFGLAIARALSVRDRAAEQARIDSLTHTLNRAAFDQALASEVCRARRYGHPFGVLLFDVDHFKSVNDRHGHARGDDALRAIAEAARSVTRETDLLSRWGGDEFAVIAPATGLPGCRALAEKLRAAVARRHEGVTISIGLAQYVPGDDECSLLERADEALYRAKRNGRNCAATMRCLRPAVDVG